MDEEGRTCADFHSSERLTHWVMNKFFSNAWLSAIIRHRPTLARSRFIATDPPAVMLVIIGNGPGAFQSGSAGFTPRTLQSRNRCNRRQLLTKNIFPAPILPTEMHSDDSHPVSAIYTAQRGHIKNRNAELPDMPDGLLWQWGHSFFLLRGKYGPADAAFSPQQCCNTCVVKNALDSLISGQSLTLPTHWLRCRI